jgi:hypothetical protein
VKSEQTAKDRLSVADQSRLVRRVVNVIADELAIEAGSRDHRVLSEKTSTLSMAFPQERPLLDLMRRSARILLKPGSDAEED